MAGVFLFGGQRPVARYDMTWLELLTTGDRRTQSDALTRGSQEETVLGVPIGDGHNQQRHLGAPGHTLAGFWNFRWTDCCAQHGSHVVER